ncbi:MAG: NADH-quinone oxidoreductase subunit NuoE [Bdellovibrionales bacterium]
MSEAYNNKLSQDEKQAVQKELKRFESRRSAVLPALYIVQKDRGWISEDLVEELSKEMEIPSSDILEVRNFYTMFNQKPVGKLHVQVCTNISCSMNGGRELTRHICEKYNVGLEEVSSCGKVSVSQVECLGACDKAPMMQVNDKYHEDLTKESAIEILERVEL